MPVKTRKVVIRWQAVYETTIEVPVDSPLDSQAVMDYAADIPIDVPGSTYQADTWEVEKIKEQDANQEKIYETLQL